MNKSEIVLFNKKEECCGCSACVNICPKKAISMYEDEYGFLYPKINKDKCIKCEMCKNVCTYQNKNETNNPINTYVAVSKSKQILSKSASGGVFATIAGEYLKNDGVVFGAAFDGNFNLNHIGITDEKFIYKLQGSKYVQSNIGNAYRECKKFLDKGVQVLFSGTPCQIAGLNGYLMKEYDNLLRMDIICHGVPSNSFFKDYIKVLNKKNYNSIFNFKFRDKSIGWGTNGSFECKIGENVRKKKLYCSESSYYYYFSNAQCFRENCYTCKYACENRPGDITIGDYWGIESAHPELLVNKNIIVNKGVSVVISNTLKGEKLLKECEELEKYDSNFNKAKRKNAQLNAPSVKGEKYSQVMNIYKNQGYNGVEKLYNKSVGLKRYRDRIKSKVPNSVKIIIKKFVM